MIIIGARNLRMSVLLHLMLIKCFIERHQRKRTITAWNGVCLEL